MPRTKHFTKIFDVPQKVRPYYSSAYFKHYRKFEHPHKHTICASYTEKFTELYIGYLEGKDVQNSHSLRLAICIASA